MSNSKEQTNSQSSDEAPEAISISASKIQAFNIEKKEREVQQKLLGIKKRKRREIDAKIKEQKSRKLAKLSKKSATFDSKKKVSNNMKKINEDGLSKFLPTELLEDFANDDKMKRRKQNQLEEHIQVKLKMSKIESPIKKKSKKHSKTGSFTVIALQDLDLDKPAPISEEITEFNNNHFYGERLPRKNAILNVSQGRKGAAIRFCRK